MNSTEKLPEPQHFNCEITAGIARISLNRPERKNPLTLESYAELRDWFRALVYSDGVHAVVILPNGGNFSSGGDVHEIIGPLTKMNMKELLAFTRMTGDLVKTMINCGKPIIAAVDGVCAGAGAILAMASDLRIGTADTKVSFLFNRVGLAGCDMGACASDSIACSRLIDHSCASMVLVMELANTGPSAIRCAMLMASLSSASLLTSALKNPQS